MTPQEGGLRSRSPSLFPLLICGSPMDHSCPHVGHPDWGEGVVVAAPALTTAGLDTLTPRSPAG